MQSFRGNVLDRIVRDCARVFGELVRAQCNWSVIGAVAMSLFAVGLTDIEESEE